MSRLLEDETPRRPFAEEANRLQYEHPAAPYPVWKTVVAAALIFGAVGWGLLMFIGSLIDG